jgi:hypothetical protein
MTSRQTTRFSLWLLLILTLACMQVDAQDNSSQTANAPVIPADELNRGTPHRSAKGFLKAAMRLTTHQRPNTWTSEICGAKLEN